jgi:N-acetylglucosaminyldiphosphoundecaprenol N-acetyl-beta-D-mannosaminyltransferase
VQIVRIGGIPIAATTYEEALQRFLDAPAADRRLAVHFCTAHTLVEAANDPELRAGLLDHGLNVPDGVPLAWVGRARGYRIERVCGLDVLPDLANRGRAQAARHYFYGGAEGVAEALAARLVDQYPGLIVAGYESPPFRPLTDDEAQDMVRRLNDARPDFIWVGLGTPKQDLWIASYRPHLEAAALMAVGAAFEIVGGRRPRAPLAMQRAGLEWLWRLWQEPRRLARRYTVTNARFVFIAFRDILAARRRPSG